MAWRRLHLRVVAAITLVVLAVVAVSAGAVYLAEKDAPGTLIRTYPDSLWWAMETISTVGYGDLHPVTLKGRIVAVGLMVLGIALIGVITATVVAWFFQEFDLHRDVKEIEQTEEDLTETLAVLMDEVRRLHQRLDQLNPLDR